SSRRRHTRLVSDWSSDVYSSDLQEVGNGSDEEGLARFVSRELSIADVCTPGMASALLEVGALRLKLLLEKDQREEYACIGIAHRSEERRVGEEGRARVGAGQ